MAFLDKTGLQKLWSNIVANFATKAELADIDVQDEIYIGSGEMPEGYTLQINPEGDAVVIANIPVPEASDAGKALMANADGGYELGTVSGSVGKATAEGGEIFNDYTNNIAEGEYSHAEGKGTTAGGNYSHSEGWSTLANGAYSHAEGHVTTASGICSHAEGIGVIASGDYSHAEGDSTIASGEYSHVQGKYNIEDTENKYAHIVGNGEDEVTRLNAHTLDWEGNAWFQGNIKVGGTGQDDATALLVPPVVMTTTDPGAGATVEYPNGTVVLVYE